VGPLEVDDADEDEGDREGAEDSDESDVDSELFDLL
jgi:hypothetical protein